ncbi:MAG: TIGR03987 family protein [Lachnospiraceae bacterium]|nr:TIGR03987 family protein [Lachnospiraceae bacterium]
MSMTLIFAIITITLALIFYSIGVWSEHRAKLLKWPHVAFFLAGFVMDTTGTTLMTRMASGNSGNALMSIHSITGAIAIILMLAHAIWAIIVMIRGKESEKSTFHRFSLIVWAIWLIPYVLGMAMGMGK